MVDSIELQAASCQLLHVDAQKPVAQQTGHPAEYAIGRIPRLDRSQLAASPIKHTATPLRGLVIHRCDPVEQCKSPVQRVRDIGPALHGMPTLLKWRKRQADNPVRRTIGAAWHRGGETHEAR